MKNLNLKLAFLCLFGTYSIVQATHNIAGEIVFEQIGPNEIEASIITYTFTSSIPADRSALELCWGDGICEEVLRVNGPLNDQGIGLGVSITPNIKMNIYTATHSYPTNGAYTLSMTDPNRNAGIVNLNYPNSEQVPFYIQTEIQLTNLTGNNSPILLQPPVDVAYRGVPFTHNVGAYDQDGDSLAYALTVPLQGANEVPNFEYPDMINAGPDNTFSLDPITGELTWDAPQLSGVYNIAITITSYRDGEIQDIVLRDMQIQVIEADNLAPDIEVSVPTEIIQEVLVGSTQTIQVSAEDMDVNQNIILSSTSGLYDNFTVLAAFEAENNGNQSAGTFTWEVKEEHLRTAPYTILFKAKDQLEAASFALVRYRVVETLSNVEENLAIRSLKIYPNPAGRVLRVQLDATLLGSNFRISTLNGQVLQQGILSNIEQEIELIRLNPGLFIFQAGSFIQKFIIE